MGRGGVAGSISIGPAVVLSRLALNYSSAWLVLPRPGESRRAANTERLTQKGLLNFFLLVPAAHGRQLVHFFFFGYQWEQKAF